MLKVWKKLWEPFRSCLLNSTTTPAKLGWKGAGLAVLFSRQLSNGSHEFFQTFSLSFKDDFIKNLQTTIALPFLTHNISTIGGVQELNTQGSLNFVIIILCQTFEKSPKGNFNIREWKIFWEECCSHPIKEEN